MRLHPPAAPGVAPGAAALCWLVVHALNDASAAALAEALQGQAAAQGVSVRSVPMTALTGWVRWGLRVESGGTRCTLQAPTLALAAGRPSQKQAPPWAALAGVVNRCGPVQLPAGVADADYKSAEWNALLAAWLNGLPCPVINRPLAHRLHAAFQSPAAWRKAAATCGLPVWPWPGGHVGGADAAAQVPQAGIPAEPRDGDTAGLLVVGQRVFEAPGAARPGWNLAAHRAAAQAASDCGCQLLAWTGRPDHQGRWRITGANPWPDMRAFGHAAIQALADALAQPALDRPARLSGPSTAWTT